MPVPQREPRLLLIDPMLGRAEVAEVRQTDRRPEVEMVPTAEPLSAHPFSPEAGLYPVLGAVGQRGPC